MKQRSHKARLGALYERNGVWQLRFMINGREYRESARTTDREVALALLEKRRNEVIEARSLGPRPERVTFAMLVALIEADYKANDRKSTESMRARVAPLTRTFKNTPPAEITHAMLKSYVAKRRAEGAAPATIRYELVLLGRMFTLAIQDELLITRPLLPTIKVNNARKGFVTEEEFGRLLALLPFDLAPAIAFMYTTGWRVGEVRGLKWGNVDFAEGVVRIEGDATKNEEARTFPFAAHKQLAGLLTAQRELVAEMGRARGKIIPWVFPREDGRQLASFRKVWDRACKEAGLGGRVPHDMRRSVVRNLERAGVSRSVAMKLTGHKTEAIYRRYAIVSETDLAEAVGKVSKRG